jgi:HSP20 family protein
MTMLRRWDPFEELVSTRSLMNRMISNFLSAAGDWDGGESSLPMQLPLDVSETDDAYMVRASLPGIKPEELDISVQNNTLTIRGETKHEGEREGERWHVRERHFGQFQRTITLPNNVDANQVGAIYEDGVLKLTLPKSEEAKPRKISVRSGGQQTIEGQAQPRSSQQTTEGQAQQRS